MSAILSSDLEGPSEGGGATYPKYDSVTRASPAALSFLHSLCGDRIESPLSLANREELDRRFGDTGGALLHSLLAEQDPELFFRGLLNFAHRQEGSGHESNAIQIYQALTQTKTPEDISRTLRRRLEILNGKGGFGDRAEFLLSRFTKQATEPAPLLAMGAAGLAFRAVRGMSLARLLGESSGVWTRGLGARSLAVTNGFVAEVLAFSGAMHSAKWTMGTSDEGIPYQQELVHGAMFLGVLKAFAGLGKFLQKSWALPAASGNVLQQTVLFTGIHSVQMLERAVGFRAGSPGDAAWVDSLATLLGLQVSARLSQSLLGSRFAAWERGLDLRTSALTRQGQFSEGLRFPLQSLRVGAFAGKTSSSLHSMHAVLMSSGSSHGDNSGPPSRPSSSFPPRSSDFFVKNPPGIVKVSQPPPHLAKVIDLLMTNSFQRSDALTQAARELDWLMPEDRLELVKYAAEISGPEALVLRLTEMATSTGSRSAAVHSLRLLLILQSGNSLLPSMLTTQAMEKVGGAVSPDPQKAGEVLWKVTETRLLRELDAAFSSEVGESRRHGLIFEMELARLISGGSSRRFFDDLLAFSLELKNPKPRQLAASSAVSLALGHAGKEGVMREFMNGYYVVSQLAKAGHIRQAVDTSRLSLLRSQAWEQSGYPKDYVRFLQRRLGFQGEVVGLYSEILKDPQSRLQDYYQLYAESGRYHLPETWGLIATLREHGTLLHSQSGNLTMNAMLRFQAAQSIFRDMVVEPFLGKTVAAVPELRASRDRLLELMEELPFRTRAESQEPLQALFNALASRQEWREAYQFLDAVFHLQLADPAFLRSLHASLLVNLDIAQHRAQGTPQYESLAAQIKRFSDFESRFF